MSTTETPGTRPSASGGPSPAPTDDAPTGRHEAPNAWASGLALFAAVMMMVVGAFQILGGFAAIIHDQVFVAVPGAVFALDLSVWGWIHLLLGIGIAAAGIGVLSGRVWARMTGILLAALSLISHFAFVPYQPFWALLVVAVDVAVVWALATYDPRGETTT